MKPYEYFSSSPPSSSTLTVGDYIGVESCLDLMTSCESDVFSSSPVLQSSSSSSSSSSNSEYLTHQYRSKRDERWAITNKEVPPPIPLLARTENLPSHMPWVLKRYYTGDGRLILREEKVRHHEYFRAHRSDGRLTLQLVPLETDAGHDEEEDYNYTTDEEVLDECGDDGGEYCTEDDNDDQVIINNINDDDDVNGEEDQVRVGSMETCQKEIGGGGKCLKYNCLRRSSSACIFGVPVPVPAV